MRLLIQLFALCMFMLIAIGVQGQAKYAANRLRVYETNIRDYLNDSKCNGLHEQFSSIQSNIVSGSFEANPAVLDNEISKTFATIARAGKSMAPDCIQKARVLLQHLRECKVYGNESQASYGTAPAPAASKESPYYPLYQRPKGKATPATAQVVEDAPTANQPAAKVPVYRGNPSNLTLEQIEQLIEERNGKLQQQFDREITNALESVSLAVQPEDTSNKLSIWILVVSVLGLIVSIVALIISLRANRMVNELDVDFNEVYEKVSMGGVSKMDVDGMIRTSKSLLEAEITLLRTRISALESRLETQAFSSTTFTQSVAPSANLAESNNLATHVFYLPAPDGMGIFKGGQISDQFIPTKTMYKVTRIDNSAGILELVDDSTTLRTANYSFYDTLRPACEAENPYEGGSDKDISQSAEGKVSLTPSGDWRVTEKIRIRYI